MQPGVSFALLRLRDTRCHWPFVLCAATLKRILCDWYPPARAEVQPSPVTKNARRNNASRTNTPSCVAADRAHFGTSDEEVVDFDDKLGLPAAISPFRERHVSVTRQRSRALHLHTYNHAFNETAVLEPRSNAKRALHPKVRIHRLSPCCDAATSPAVTSTAFLARSLPNALCI